MALPPFAPATTGVELRQRHQALPLRRRSRHREHSLSARTPNFSPDPRPTPRSMHRCNRRPRPCWMRPTAPDPAARLIPEKSSSRVRRPFSRSTAPCSRSGHRRSAFHRAWSPGHLPGWGGSRLRRQVRAATASSFHQAGFPATVPPAGCSDAGCPPRPFQATLGEVGRLGVPSVDSVLVITSLLRRRTEESWRRFRVSSAAHRLWPGPRASSTWPSRLPRSTDPTHPLPYRPGVAGLARALPTLLDGHDDRTG
jgi:hypothetical protein